MKNIIPWLKKNPLFFLNILSGTVLALSYTVSFLQPFSFFVFITFILSFYQLKGKKLFGHALAFMLSFWITLVYWTYIYATIAFPMLMLLFVIYTGLFTFVASIVLPFSGRFRFLVFPVLWVGYEYFLGLGYLGFPWGTSGVALHSLLPFIQIADFSGIWGVSFFLFLMNALLAEIWLHRNDRKRVIVFASLSILLVSCVMVYGLVSLNVPLSHTGFKVGLVQGTLDPNSKWNEIKETTYARLKELTEVCVKDGANLVSWWETPVMDYALYYLWIYDTSDKKKLDKRFKEMAEYDRKFFNIAKEYNVPIMTGLPDAIPKGNTYDFYNAAVLVGTNGEALGRYYKMHLVPFGEWFPYAKIFPFVENLLESLGAGQYTPGTEYKVFEVRGKKFSVVICYEGIFGEISRRFVNHGAEFLVNITDDMWSFSEAAEKQHAYLDVFRAVENRVSFVRAANAGLTCHIDPHGRIRNSIPLFKPGHLTVDLLDHPKRGKTLYSVFGDWVGRSLFFLSLVLFMASLFIVIIRKLKQRL